VRVGSTVRPAFLSQELGELPMSLRVLEAVEEIARRVVLGKREISASQLAEEFGFTDRRLWTVVGDLSGGERRRLQLLRLMAAEPNVLLLDEPTNDLDTDTLAALEDLLDSWPGTLVVASHDRYLLERVCDRMIGMFGDGRLRDLPGGVDEYLSLLAPVTSSSAAASRPAKADSRAAQKEMARLEKLVDRLTRREEKLHDQLASNATDYEKVAALDQELREVRSEREAAEEAWLQAAE
jgi:ABC-type multidrug transport system ATPase subunit